MNVKIIDQEKAKEVAIGFFNLFQGKLLHFSNKINFVFSSNNLKLNNEVKNDNETFYVFTLGEIGFVIVSGVTAVNPILGYSLSSKFDNDNIPDQLLGVLNDYDVQIQEVFENISTLNHHKDWESILEGNFKLSHSSNDDVVSPLIETKWGQSDPYNRECPQGCPTGCVATAMAQIIYYHVKKRGTGKHEYVTETHKTLQSADFGSTIYFNPNIPTLMHHCGVSVDMDYKPGSSGAITSKVADALKKYFDYSSAEYVKRDSFSDADWKQMLKNELNNKRPIQYKGRNSKSGHSFICDGYNSVDYFHFNWGWNGTSDGYFTIDTLNPSGRDYNSDQGAVINIIP